MSSNERDQLLNTVIITAIAAFLGYMAFGGAWHAALFGFIAFNTTAQGNRAEGTPKRTSRTTREGD